MSTIKFKLDRRWKWVARDDYEKQWYKYEYEPECGKTQWWPTYGSVERIEPQSFSGPWKQSLHKRVGENWVGVK
jgi:hypothetical protein